MTWTVAEELKSSVTFRSFPVFTLSLWLMTKFSCRWFIWKPFLFYKLWMETTKQQIRDVTNASDTKASNISCSLTKNVGKLKSDFVKCIYCIILRPRPPSSSSLYPLPPLHLSPPAPTKPLFSDAVASVALMLVWIAVLGPIPLPIIGTKWGINTKGTYTQAHTHATVKIITFPHKQQCCRVLTVDWSTAIDRTQRQDFPLHLQCTFKTRCATDSERLNCLQLFAWLLFSCVCVYSAFVQSHVSHPVCLQDFSGKARTTLQQINTGQILTGVCCITKTSWSFCMISLNHYKQFLSWDRAVKNDSP